MFLDNFGVAEDSDTRAFHLVERCCSDVLLSVKSENFMFRVLITILLVVAYPGTKLCACGL